MNQRKIEVVRSLHDTANLQPQSVELEESILGGVLIDPVAIARVEEAGLKSEHFYIGAHRQIFKAAMDLYLAGQPVDWASVELRLKDLGQLEGIGGSQRLVQLIDRTVSAANIDFYAERVIEKAKRRSLIDYGANVQRLAGDTAKPLDEVVDEVERGLYGAREAGEADRSLTLGESMSKVVANAIARSQSQDLPGLSTGFYDLDSMTQGLQRKELIIVAARPAMGKSAISAQMALTIAEAEKKPVVFFSLEMSDETLSARLIASRAKVDSGRIRTARLSPDDWSRIGVAQAELSEIPMIIDAKRGLTASQIRSKCRRLAVQYGELGAVFVDYLQIMGGADDDRVQSLGKITRSLRDLASELNAPVVLLSQLNRGVESRTNKRPMMSDLKESGSIEEDADLVLMLYRDEYYDSNSADRGVAEVICTKNRNGPAGTVKLLFQPEFTQFLNRKGGIG